MYHQHLVSFAVGVEKAKNIISPEFKEVGSSLVLLQTEKLEDGTINIDKLKKNLEVLYTLIQDKKVISASAIKFGGVSEALTKMTLGNRIGARI